VGDRQSGRWGRRAGVVVINIGAPPPQDEVQPQQSRVRKGLLVCCLGNALEFSSHVVEVRGTWSF
jgi:hypothetical protein